MGIQSLTATAEELAELRFEVRALVGEILNRLHMSEQGQGIGQLITMHTLDFDVQARGHEYEASLLSINKKLRRRPYPSLYRRVKVHFRFDQ